MRINEKLINEISKYSNKYTKEIMMDYLLVELTNTLKKTNKLLKRI